MVYRPNFRQRTHVYDTRPVRKLGGLKWKVKAGDFVYSPTVVGELVYFGSGDRAIMAVDASNGHEEWQFQAEADITGGLIIHEGVIYFARGKEFCALDMKSSRIKWTFSA